MSKYRIAVVTSRFNEAVTTKLLDSCLLKLKELGVENTKSVHVPGAVELPLVAQTLAKTKQYDAIICLGAVIRGETSHYDFVCQQVSAGVMQVMLQEQLPVIFGVLTTENSEQAFARAGGDHSDKGADAAECALEMIGVLDGVR